MHFFESRPASVKGTREVLIDDRWSLEERPRTSIGNKLWCSPSRARSWSSSNLTVTAIGSYTWLMAFLRCLLLHRAVFGYRGCSRPAFTVHRRVYDCSKKTGELWRPLYRRLVQIYTTALVLVTQNMFSLYSYLHRWAHNQWSATSAAAIVLMKIMQLH